jgi:hypothetical protein
MVDSRCIDRSTAGRLRVIKSTDSIVIMSDAYTRADRFGQQREKLVLWLPVELKDRLRQEAARRRMSMGAVAADAIRAELPDGDAGAVDGR